MDEISYINDFSFSIKDMIEDSFSIVDTEVMAIVVDSISFLG